MARYDFLTQGRSYDSMHPSLQHQAEANMGFGLYEVVPGRIYQVRGLDISNISFIKGDSGWIVFDPLTTRETAAAALALVTEVGKRRCCRGLLIRTPITSACRDRRGGRQERQAIGRRASWTTRRRSLPTPAPR
jgi:alkyl sulfatase BDS1-like metallo-beta-lactamase superfamily hydrolase